MNTDTWGASRRALEEQYRENRRRYFQAFVEELSQALDWIDDGGLNGPPKEGQ